MSSRLSSESRIYADKARDLNRQVSHFMFSFIIHMISNFFAFLFLAALPAYSPLVSPAPNDPPQGQIR